MTKQTPYIKLVSYNQRGEFENYMKYASLCQQRRMQTSFAVVVSDFWAKCEAADVLQWCLRHGIL